VHLTELDAALTTWTNSWTGGSATIDFVMTWVSTLGVPVLVLAVAVQWWLPRADLRPRYHAHYYAAFILDPDGYNLEAVCHSEA
jgi:hypothetical protein